MKIKDVIWLHNEGGYNSPATLRIGEMPDLSMVHMKGLCVYNGYDIRHTDRLPNADRYILENCRIDVIDIPKHDDRIWTFSSCHIGTIKSLPINPEFARFGISCEFAKDAAVPPHRDMYIGQKCLTTKMHERWKQQFGEEKNLPQRT